MDEPTRGRATIPAFPWPWERSRRTASTAFGPGRPGKGLPSGVPSTPFTAGACWSPARTAPRGPSGSSVPRGPVEGIRCGGRCRCSWCRRRRPSRRGWSTRGALRSAEAMCETRTPQGGRGFFTGWDGGGHPESPGAGNCTRIAERSINSMKKQDCFCSVLKRGARSSCALLFQAVPQNSTGIFTDLSTAAVDFEGSEIRSRAGISKESVSLPAPTGLPCSAFPPERSGGAP